MKPTNRKTKSKTVTRAGRPPLSQATEREEALFDAATSIFLEHGFLKASTNEIARRAGASKETLYSRFPTKAALFTALIERRAEKTFAAISASTSAGGNWEEALLPLCRQWVIAHLVPENRQLYEVIAAEACRFPALATTYWEKATGRAYKMLRELLAAQAKAGRLEFANLDWATEQLLGALSGTAVPRYALGVAPFLKSPSEIDEWVRSVLSSFVKSHAAFRRAKRK